MYIILLYIPKLLWSVLWVSMFSWILVFLHTLSTKWEYIVTIFAFIKNKTWANKTKQTKQTLYTSILHIY